MECFVDSQSRLSNMNEILTDRNFILFAAQNYRNPGCTDTCEFLQDLARIKYIRKLITRYIENKELKERLILNHIIILNNTFGPEAVVKIFYLKLEDYMQYIKPFLIMIGIMPDRIYNVKSKGIIDATLIPLDQKIVTALRSIKNAI